MRRPVFTPLALALLCAAAVAPGARARAEGATYEVRKGHARATVGVKGKTSVTIAAKPGWHVNEEAPLTMKLTPDPGIAVDKPRLTRADLAEQTKETARFDVAFTPSEPGVKTINAEASFVMCQATTCMPVKEKIALAVEVVAPTKKK
jgi:DsbC/DsbD-like thiol-disulfide interchange protein